jgi:hypothetical protein
MQSMNARRLAGVAGIIFVVLTMVGNFMAPAPPAVDETGAEWLDYLTDNRGRLLAGWALALLGSLFAVFFASGIWRALRNTEGEGGVVATGAILGLIIGATVIAAGGGLFYGAAYQADFGLEAADARLLVLTSYFVFLAAPAPFAAYSLGAGWLMSQGTGFGRYIGWLALLVGVINVLATFSMARDGAFQPLGPVGLLSFLGIFVLFLLQSVWLVRQGEGVRREE